MKGPLARLTWVRDVLALPLTDEALARIAAAGGADPLRVGVSHEAELAADRGRRRAAGVYYTPAHLVDLVVERTVGHTAGDAAEPVRVLDPACGAGVFLVAALERLEREASLRGRAPGPRLRAELAAGLAGIDVDSTAVALARLALGLAVLGDGALEAGDLDDAGLVAATAGVRVGDALLDDVDGGFDVVIGNPPWGQKGYRFAPEAAARLRARYRSAGRGPLDPFALFVERAHQLARSGGRWGLVLPDPILLKSHEAVRTLILAGAAVEWIADAGRAFRDVGLDVVVLVARRAEPPPSDHRVRLWHRVPAAWRDQPPPTRVVPQALFERLPGRRFNLHLDEADAERLARLAELPCFGDDFAVHEGVHSGNRRAALFLAAPPAGPCARLVVGKEELRPFRLTWGGGWIDLDPAAVDRAGGGYANLGRPSWFMAGKLVVRRTGDRVMAARDRVGFHVSNNAFVALPRADLDDDEVDAWLALLNSSFATWWFRAQVPRTGRAFAELKIRELVALPRPADEAWRGAVPALAALARRLEEDGVAPEPMTELDGHVAAAFAAGHRTQRGG